MRGKKRQYGTRGETAYKLRTEEGWKWTTIALEMGYKNKDCARATAVRWAAVRGLPLPLPPVVETQPRRCLGCGCTFDSEGIWNRLCGGCKGDSAWSGPTEMAVQL